MSQAERAGAAKADIEMDTARRVSANPGDADARLNLAYAYQQDAQYQKALAEYDKVLQQRPKDTAALYNKGVVYMTLGGRQGRGDLVGRP